LELVEGREASQIFTIGRRRGLAKARSITEGPALLTRGNLVYSPGGLRRAKLASAAVSKSGSRRRFPVVRRSAEGPIGDCGY